LHLREIDLRRILEDVTAWLSQSGNAGVHIERNFPREPVPVNVDVDLIKQAVLNVMPQWRFRQCPGWQLAHLSRPPKMERPWRKFRIRALGFRGDNGEIFTLYFTTKKAGSGIGLAMAYRVDAAHHGFVDFRPAPERGTTFEPHLASATGGLRCNACRCQSLSHSESLAGCETMAQNGKLVMLRLAVHQ